MQLPDFLIDHPDGEIRLTGHRIGLYSVVRVSKEGQTPEQISETFPTLPVDLVRKVIAFYHQNQSEVDAYVDAVSTEIDRQAKIYNKGPSLAELRQRMEALRRIEAH